MIVQKEWGSWEFEFGVPHRVQDLKYTSLEFTVDNFAGIWVLNLSLVVLGFGFTVRYN